MVVRNFFFYRGRLEVYGAQRYNMVFGDWDREAKHMLIGGANGFSDARQIPDTLLKRSVNSIICGQQPTFAESRDPVHVRI